MDSVSLALLVGFFGDLSLQLMVKFGMGGPDGWGLKPYFKQHSSVESLCIAAGMLAIFMVIFNLIFRKKMSNIRRIIYLGIYGIILDLVFRITKVFPSLEGYYNHLNYFWSAVWGAIPMMLIGVAMIFFGKHDNCK